MTKDFDGVDSLYAVCGISLNVSSVVVDVSDSNVGSPGVVEVSDNFAAHFPVISIVFDCLGRPDLHRSSLALVVVRVHEHALEATAHRVGDSDAELFWGVLRVDREHLDLFHGVVVAT